MAAYHGAECQPDRIVERADGENDALGFFSDDGAKGYPVDVERRLFCACPLVDTVISNLAVADGRVEFEAAWVDDETVSETSTEAQRNAQGRLERWAPEVLCKRPFETVIVVLEEVGELENLSLAGLDGLELSGPETLAQVGVDLVVDGNGCIEVRSWMSEGNTHPRYLVERGVYKFGRHVGGSFGLPGTRLGTVLSAK